MSNEQFAITRRIEIDAAHRVPDHKSKCYNIHGHRYVIEAKCSGKVIETGEQTGMVMDFGFLKACMIAAIHDPCDHGTIFYQDDHILREIWAGIEMNVRPHWGPNTYRDGWKLYVMGKVPTAENLAEHWYHELSTAIFAWFEQFSPIPQSNYPKLVEVKVWEIGRAHV